MVDDNNSTVILGKVRGQKVAPAKTRDPAQMGWCQPLPYKEKQGEDFHLP